MLGNLSNEHNELINLQKPGDVCPVLGMVQSSDMCELQKHFANHLGEPDDAPRPPGLK